MSKPSPANSSAPTRAGATPSSLMRRVRRLPPVEWLVSYLFGDDVFISYSRRDGIKYAVALSHKLSDAGHSVRMDVWETEPGKQTPEKVMRALRRSRNLVLVATPGALQSPHVAQEVAFYRQTHPDRTNIIPVHFSEGVPDALWLDQVEGLPWLSDEEQSLIDSIPSAPVVNRINAGLRFTRRNRRLFYTSLFSLGVLLLLLGLSGAATAYAITSLLAAEAANAEAVIKTHEAQLRQEEADRSAQQAERQRLVALFAQTEAVNQSIEAERQAGVADKQSKLAASANRQREAAERATETARELEKQARANAAEQQRIAYSRRLAGHADRSMSERLDLGLLLGAEAYSAQDASRPTFEARRTLLTPFTEYKKLAFMLRPSDDRNAHYSQVAATGDGQTVVAARTDGKIIFWNVALKKERAVEAASVVNVADGLALTPDGKKMATTGGDGKLVLWDVEKGVRLGVVGHDPDRAVTDEGETEQHPEYFHVVALDDQTIVTGGEPGELVFWDISTPDSPRRLRRFSYGKDERGQQKEFFSLSAGAGGKRLVTGGEHGSVRFLDVTNVRTSEPRLLKELKEGEADVEMVVYSLDGKFLTSVDEQGEFLIWYGGSDAEVPTHPVHMDKPAGVNVQSLAFNRDSSLLVVARSTGEVETHNLKTFMTTEDRVNPVGRYLPGVTAAAFSADSRYVVTGNGDGTLMFWNTDTPGLLVREFKGYDNKVVLRTAFTPDKRLMASGDETGTVALTDLTVPDAKPSPLAPRAHAAKVTGLAFAPDGELLASGDVDGGLVIWSRQSGGGWTPSRLPVESVRPVERPGPLMSAIANPHAVSLVAFADHGRKLVSVGPGAQVVFWDVRRRVALRTVPLPDRRPDGRRALLWGVAASRDGGKLALGYDDNSLYLLDTTDDRSKLQPLEGHRREVYNVAFSNDGRRLASVDDSGEGIIWELGARRPRCSKRFRARPLQENPDATYTSGIKAIAFGQSDKTLALGGSGTVILLDVESNSPIGDIVEERLGDNISFSPDGNTIVFGSRGEVVLLDINPATWARHAREIANRPLAEWERAQFMAGGSESKSECAAQPGLAAPRKR